MKKNYIDDQIFKSEDYSSTQFAKGEYENWVCCLVRWRFAQAVASDPLDLYERANRAR